MDLSCWLGVVFLGFSEFCVFRCCGIYFYTQALRGGGVLFKKWVWVGVEMATKTKVFQFSEVQTHGSPTDCWIMIHGKVVSFVHHHHPPKHKSFQVLPPNTCMYVLWIVCLFVWFFLMFGFSFWGLSQVVISNSFQVFQV